MIPAKMGLRLSVNSGTGARSHNGPSKGRRCSTSGIAKIVTDQLLPLWSCGEEKGYDKR